MKILYLASTISVVPNITEDPFLSNISSNKKTKYSLIIQQDPQLTVKNFWILNVNIIQLSLKEFVVGPQEHLKNEKPPTK